MSGATSAINAPNAGRAAKALSQADDGIGKWLKDLVTGQGSSPAHIIITGVIGVVPGLGQAFDVRDLILGIIALSANPANPLVWVDLLITLVGFIPGLGDAFKVCFKLVRQGHGVGRVLDALRAVLKGDVDKWLRNINWNAVGQQSRNTLDGALKAFINGLDSWAVKLVAGKGNVDLLISELKGIQRIAPQRLAEALEELKKLHKKILDDIAPASTAKTAPGGSAKAASNAADAKALPSPTPAQRGSGSTPKKQDQTGRNQGAPDTRKTDQPREAKKKRDNWYSGVLPEHIADYHVAKNHTNFKKINDHGRKVEERDGARGPGIDHIWRVTTVNPTVFASSGKGGKPYVIAETKGSLIGSFAFLSALTPDLRQHFDALRADEANGNGPNAFGNEQRDSSPTKKAELQSDQGLTKGGRDEYGKRQQGLNSANEKTGLATQMSHKWIARNASSDATLVAPEATKLRSVIRDFREGDIPCPYHRWVLMVTGRQKHQHESSKKQPPHVHHVQRPIVVLPDNRQFLWS